MKDLNYFKDNAVERSLCKDYALYWQQSKTKESLFSLALIPQSIPYIATSTYQGWGMSTDYLCVDFSEYINGKYIVKNLDDVEGATASFYVSHNDHIITQIEDVMHFMDCKNLLLYIPNYKATQMHISNNSKIEVRCGFGYINIYMYDKSELDLGRIKNGCVVNVHKYSPDCKVAYVNDGGVCHIRDKQLKI